MTKSTTSKTITINVAVTSPLFFHFSFFMNTITIIIHIYETNAHKKTQTHQIWEKRLGIRNHMSMIGGGGGGGGDRRSVVCVCVAFLLINESTSKHNNESDQRQKIEIERKRERKKTCSLHLPAHTHTRTHVNPTNIGF